MTSPIATAIFDDSYGGPTQMVLAPIRTRKGETPRFRWEPSPTAAYQYTTTGQARALPRNRAINFARAHRGFSHIEVQV